ncbi:hypothetical protein J7I98_12710 [Streptomyces sp. ISL-98]|uniref:hypothetical protein n=1 Tax=Streptomyces sp. ISL-98 TaxID=2819192 RepID=UPI001BE77141|nr:hypothetical protein [Streptomyces sp. ISL-98]MBT2506735.1 hypothetical protein [Streptomyces sp. ISL-98]
MNKVDHEGWMQDVSTPPPASRTAVRLRIASVVAAVLLIPGTVVAWVVSVSTEQGGRCLMHGGEYCGASAPGWVFTAALTAAFVAWCVVLFVPSRVRESERIRRAALWVQLAMEGLFLLLVVAAK